MASKSSFSKTNLKASRPASELDTSVDEPGLAETSSFMKTALSSFITARVELASIEAKEAAEFTLGKMVHAIVLAISAFFVWALLLAALTGLLAPFADQWLKGINWLPGWAAVLFALAIIHSIVALIALNRLKKKLASPLFELSRQEIENDKQWLKENK